MLQGKRNLFNYFLCPGCGCLQISEFPENLKDYYKDYYTTERAWKELSILKKYLWKIRSFISDYKIYSFIEKINFNSILQWKRKAGLNNLSRILDVGCGSGDILYEFRKHGFINLTGIDPQIKNNLKIEGIELFRNTILEIEGKFDFIMFNHSFEHIWEQHETLEKAKSLLGNGGVILLRLPILNTVFQIYRGNWVQIDAPRHFYLHSLESIEWLCKCHRLKIYHKYFDSSEFQFIGSEQYKNGIALNADNSFYKNHKASIFSNSDIRKFKKQARLLNKEGKGDQVVLFIKRIEED